MASPISPRIDVLSPRAVSRRHVSSPITPVTTAGVTGLDFPSPVDSSAEESSTRPASARRRPRASRLDSSSSSSKLGLVEISSTPPELGDAVVMDDLWNTLRLEKEVKLNKELSKVKSLEGHSPASDDSRMRSPSLRSPSRAKISDPAPAPTAPSVRTTERRSLLEDVLSSDRASPLRTPSPPQTLKRKKSITAFRTSPEKNYVVAIFDLRGVDKEDIRVTFRRDHIIVSWEKWEVENWEEDDCIARQTIERVYHRVIPLAEGTKFRDIYGTMKGGDLLLRYPLVGINGSRAL